MKKDTWKSPKTHYLEIIGDEFYMLLMELQTEIVKATHQFYEKYNMNTMFLPVTTGSISSPMGLGSDSLPVEIKMFNKKEYLADSMQFMLEYGCRFCKNGVYYLMPSFRGEEPDETHLSQFYHSEVEIIGNLNDIMKLAEEYVYYLIKRLYDKYEKKIYMISGEISHIENFLKNPNFVRMTFDDAISILKKEDNSSDFYREKENYRTILRKGEKFLLDRYGDFLWITNYDRLSVPFYQDFKKDAQHLALNADLLFGIGEVLGCGQRHFSSINLKESLKMCGVSNDEYEWYINLKERFPLQTSGFGMGVERFLMWILIEKDMRNLQFCLRNNQDIIMP